MTNIRFVATTCNCNKIHKKFFGMNSRFIFFLLKHQGLNQINHYEQRLENIASKN